MSEKITLKDEDSFILATYDNDDTFSLRMNDIGGNHVMNLIGHLAVLLETKEGIPIEEIASRLIDEQAIFSQEYVKE